MSSTHNEVAGFLSGIRVLEIADELGEYTGRVLAGLGADVVKVEPPIGERTRGYGPFLNDEPHPDRSLHFWQYNLGKRGVIADLDTEAGRERVRELALAADIVVDARAASSLADAGLGYEVLAAESPGIVFIRITPFGEDGPWQHFRGSDLVHLALGGVVMNCGYDPQPDGTYDTPPVAPQAWQAYHIAGEMAVIGLLGALVHRTDTGRGQRLWLSVHEAVSKNTELDLPDWIYSRAPHERQTCRHSMRRGDTSFDLPWIAMTKDGRWINPYRTYLQRGSSGPDLHAALRTLLERAGMSLGIDPENYADPEFRRRPEVRSHINALTDRLIAGFRYDRDIWRDAQSLGLSWAPIRRPEENLGEAHWAERATFAQVEHPELGRTLPYATGRWVCDVAPWQAQRRAPLRGEHDTEVDKAWAGPRAADSGTAARPVFDPDLRSAHGTPFALGGVKIVDLSWMVASGGAGRFLTCLGADVLKVEHSSRPDATRMSLGRAPAGGRAERDAATGPLDPEGGLNRSGFFMDMCAGKRSLSLNLKTDDGKDILRRLIADADIVIEGFSPGTLDRLGFGYDRLIELNPAIIYVQQSGLGQRGSYGAMRSYGPTAQAFSGLSEMSGLREPFPPAGIGYSYLDWFGAYNMATAMLAALYRRQRTGLGCYIDSSQVETGLYLTATALLDFAANGRRWRRYGNRAPHLRAAPHGVYPTAGTDRWIAVACLDDDDWTSLVKVLGGLLDDGRFATLEQRIVHQDELDEALGAMTAPWSGEALMAALQDAGVAAGVCQTAEDRVENDPQLRHLDWLVELRQSEIGLWPVKEFPVRFSATPPHIGGRYDRHGPSYGEDNEDVLHDLGFTDAQIAELDHGGVL